MTDELQMRQTFNHNDMAGSKNKYLEEAVPNFYRRQTIDVMIFTFIDTYRFVLPSVSVNEAASAFVKRYKISYDLLTTEAVIQSYYRTQKDLYEAEKRENKEDRKRQ